MFYQEECAFFKIQLVIKYVLPESNQIVKCMSLSEQDKANLCCDVQFCCVSSCFVCVVDSRDEAEGPLLPEEEAHSDLASFQPTDSDVPSFLEDCNRVTLACQYQQNYC